MTASVVASCVRPEREDGRPPQAGAMGGARRDADRFAAWLRGENEPFGLDEEEQIITGRDLLTGRTRVGHGSASSTVNPSDCQRGQSRASRSALPALNDGTFEAAMGTYPPVRGVFPCQAARCFAEKILNAAIPTGTPPERV